MTYWRTLPSDDDASFDRVVLLDAAMIEPQVTWGTSPEAVVPVSGRVPDPAQIADIAARASAVRMLDYMDLTPVQMIEGLSIDVVFIGSCTNARIEDIREASRIAAGRRVAAGCGRWWCRGPGR